MMVELIFLGLCLVGAFVMAMRGAPMWLWAAGAVVATYLWQSGLIYGVHQGLSFGFGSLLGWIPALGFVALAIPSLRRSILIEPAYKIIRGISCQRCPRPSSRHSTPARSASMPNFFRPARLGEVACRAADHADRGRTRVSQRPDRRVVPDDQ